MAALKLCLEGLGFSNVLTYINSGNVIVESDKPASIVKAQTEQAIHDAFELDTVNVLVLSRQQLQAAVDNKPKGFGDEPDKYYSDAIFLIGIDASDAMAVFNPREGVDKVWPGNGVIYSQRLGAERTKSRLSRIVGTPAYKSMTIRTWNTTTKLLDILQKLEESS